MTPRWPSIAVLLFLVFGLAWLILGIWTVTGGDTGPGVAQLALGVGWLLVAAVNRMRPTHRADDGPMAGRHPDDNRIEKMS